MLFGIIGGMTFYQVSRYNSVQERKIELEERKVELEEKKLRCPCR